MIKLQFKHDFTKKYSNVTFDFRQTAAMNINTCCHGTELRRRFREKINTYFRND